VLDRTLAGAGQWLPIDPPRPERTTVGGLLAAEAVIGVAYTFFGYLLLRLMERESRKRASLQIA